MQKIDIFKFKFYNCCNILGYLSLKYRCNRITWGSCENGVVKMVQWRWWCWQARHLGIWCSGLTFFSPSRDWRLEFRSWPMCRSGLDSRDRPARNPRNAVNLLWTSVHLSSGPPFPYLLTSHLYAVFIIHYNTRRFLSLHVSRYRAHEFHEHIFRNGWMDCRDPFHAALCLHCCVTDKT